LTSHLKHDILNLIRKNYLKNISKSSFVPPQKEREGKGFSDSGTSGYLT